MLEGEWSRTWKTVKGQEAQQTAEAQNRELEWIRSEAKAEQDDAELKLQRKSYLNADLTEL